MSAITLAPCSHRLFADESIKIFEAGAHTIVINETAQDAFAQINEQLKIAPAKCPLCTLNVERIDPSPEGKRRFPLSESIFSRIQISPLNVDLNAMENTAAKIHHVIHFTRVEIANIINQGQSSSDGGSTYRRLVELANDFNGLVSTCGSVVGRILYWLPTSWKASVFIRAMEEAREKGLASSSWVLSGRDGQTIGLFSLNEIQNEKFELEGELKTFKLFNVGVLLHSNFQRRGIVTELTNHLFDQFCRLNLDIDGLWIATRPDNAGVNHIANKLQFTFIKTMNVRHEHLIPCCSSTYIPMNLYVRRISQ